MFHIFVIPNPQDGAIALGEYIHNYLARNAARLQPLPRPPMLDAQSQMETEVVYDWQLSRDDRGDFKARWGWLAPFSFGAGSSLLCLGFVYSRFVKPTKAKPKAE